MGISDIMLGIGLELLVFYCYQHTTIQILYTLL
jgi:hypothetical protein